MKPLLTISLMAGLALVTACTAGTESAPPKIEASAQKVFIEGVKLTGVK